MGSCGDLVEENCILHGQEVWAEEVRNTKMKKESLCQLLGSGFCNCLSRLPEVAQPRFGGRVFPIQQPNKILSTLCQCRQGVSQHVWAERGSIGKLPGSSSKRIFVLTTDQSSLASLVLPSFLPKSSAVSGAAQTACVRACVWPCGG